MPIQSSVTGQILQGTYAVERVVGKGGFGTVYEASHLRLGRKFAVKILSAENKIEPEQLKRFWREAEVMGRLGHPHIVEIIDVNQTENGTPYIVMELLSGESLGQRLARDGRLGLGEASAVVEQVGSALDAAHAHGIVHRDLKPENIFLRAGPPGAIDVKVIDFGLSKLLAAPSLITGPHRILGTPYYMSPEQASGGEAVGPAADIFSLGVVAYQMVSGRRPFEGDSPLKVVLAVCTDEPPALAGLPGSLDAVIRRALSKAPGQRYATAHELGEAFAQAIWPSLDTDLGQMHDQLAASHLATQPFRPANKTEPTDAYGKTEPTDRLGRTAKSSLGNTEPDAGAPRVTAADGSLRRTEPDAAPRVSVADGSLGRTEPPESLGRTEPPEASPPRVTVESGSRDGATLAIARPKAMRVIWPLLIAAVVGVASLLIWRSQRTSDERAAATAQVDRGRIRPGEPRGVDGVGEGAKPREGANGRLVRPDLATTVRPVLDAALARPDTASSRLLTLLTDPPQAEVWLDGKRLGVTPLVSHPIPAGARALQVKKRGFVTVSPQLPAASHPRLQLRLSPRAVRPALPSTGTGAGGAPSPAQPAGSLGVSAWRGDREAYMRVLVDGKLCGITPKLIPGIAPGPHLVEVDDGGTRFKRDVTVAPGKKETVVIKLPP